MSGERPDLKLFYSISEVAKMFDLNESTLRFWEKEFPQLSPKKAGRGVRQYTRSDIEQIRLVHYLVKEQGLTIAGARQRLRVNARNVSRDAEILARLRSIRQELVDMRDALDTFTDSQVESLSDKVATSESLQEDVNP